MENMIESIKNILNVILEDPEKYKTSCNPYFSTWRKTITFKKNDKQYHIDYGEGHNGRYIEVNDCERNRRMVNECSEIEFKEIDLLVTKIYNKLQDIFTYEIKHFLD